MSGCKLQTVDGRVSLVSEAHPHYKPLSVDFLSPENIRLIQTGLSKKNPLLRAVGGHSREAAGNIKIFDATLGLGKDAFLLAAYGFQVHAVEKNPLVFALVEDALKRVYVAEGNHAEAGQRTASRLKVELGEAVERLRTFSGSGSAATAKNPDVVYLDPMFAAKTKTALQGKEMFLLKDLLGSGESESGEALFQAALASAGNRVVVKRAPEAPWLDGRTRPHHSIEGKLVRFDVYLR